MELLGNKRSANNDEADHAAKPKGAGKPARDPDLDPAADDEVPY